MKTINDLVERLNTKFDYADFSIKADYRQRKYYLYMETFDDYGPVIEFDKQSKDWSIKKTLGLASNEVQREIMDFIYGTDKIHWFDEQEKKYNIIIGEDANNNNVFHRKTAYQKISKGVDINDAVREEDLTSDEFKFTESEIEDLKAKLPENMAKIVDLGKAEVKDE